MPAGRVAPGEALGFGVILAVGSVTLMALALNSSPAILLAITIAFYVFVYTIWLKRRTPQNIVIGGAAGAFPPMVGWAAVDRPGRPAGASCSSRSSSSGRRRISGRCRSIAPAIMPRPACRCCRWWRARARPRSRCCSTPSRSGRWRWRRRCSHAASWFYGAPALALSAIFTLCAVRVMRDPGERRRQADVRLLAALSLPVVRAAGRRPRARFRGGVVSWLAMDPARQASPLEEPGAARRSADAGGAALRHRHDPPGDAAMSIPNGKHGGRSRAKA